MKKSQLFHGVFFVFCLFVLFAPDMSQAKVAKPFFLMGDGQIKIKNLHNGRVVDVKLLKSDGSIDSEAFQKINYVFGYPGKENGEPISERMIFMLDHFSDHFAPGKIIYLKSGYRSPKYNQSLRDKGRTAAKTSTHIDGMAIDFYLDGVDGKQMWEYIRAKDCCGAGHYGGKTVHLDSGRPRFWEQATSKVRTGASDFNRYIYLSTDYDRYQPNQKMRLFFTSISNFGFGIKPEIQYVTDKEGDEQVSKGKVLTVEKTKCVMIRERKNARFIYTDLPKNLVPGKYRIKVEFCKRPFEEMPKFSVSNEMEIVAKPDETF